MKKLFALVLVLALCLPFAAMAEDTLTIEITFEGSWVEFADQGFALYMPNEWVTLNMLDFLEEGFKVGEMTLNPQLYSMFSPDQDFAKSFNVLSFSLEDLGVDADTLIAGFETAYSETGMWITLNEIPFYVYDDAEQNLSGLFTASETTGFLFVVTPADDQDFTNLSMQILSSLTVIEE